MTGSIHDYSPPSRYSIWGTENSRAKHCTHAIAGAGDSRPVSYVSMTFDIKKSNFQIINEIIIDLCKILII